MAHSIEIGPFSFLAPATEPGFLYGDPSPRLAINYKQVNSFTLPLTRHSAGFFVSGDQQMSIDLSQVTLLKRRQVEAATSLSRSTIYDMMSKGQFPKPVRLGAQRVAWRERDIIEWLEHQVSSAVV
ncbi:MAG: helix-turn-helix transcriptional regulator [Aeromonas hydrophila]